MGGDKIQDTFRSQKPRRKTEHHLRSSFLTFQSNLVTISEYSTLIQNLYKKKTIRYIFWYHGRKVLHTQNRIISFFF